MLGSLIFLAFSMTAKAISFSGPIILSAPCVLPSDVPTMGLIQQQDDKIRVLTVPVAASRLRCLQATRADGHRVQLKLVRQSFEAGLAEFEVIGSTNLRIENPLSIKDLEVFQKSSNEHMIPWLDTGWDVLPKNSKVVMNGTPVLSEQGQWSGLVSSQKRGGLTGQLPTAEPRILIPQDYIERWKNLGDKKVLPPQTELNPYWNRNPKKLPEDLMPGLRPNSINNGGVDPIGITGEGRPDPIPPGTEANATRLLSQLETDQLIGLFVKHNEIWFDLQVKSLAQLTTALAENPDLVVLNVGGQFQNPGLQQVEIKSRRVSQSLRSKRLSEAIVLADQIRFLARFARSQMSIEQVNKEIQNLQKSQVWTPVWNFLRQNESDAFTELETLLIQIKTELKVRQ